MSIFSYLFFFSSRRRHTRSKRDWSSDVCSSDLKFRLIERIAMPEKHERVLDAGCGSGTISYFLSQHAGAVVGIDSNPSAIAYRSEERRVGKECRCWRATEQ